MSNETTNTTLIDLRKRFVEQMRRVPGAVAIIAVSVGDNRTGLAATAWTSLTADPPTILACVNREASASALILDARKFSLNLLPSDETETCAIFSAQRHLSGSERFVHEGWSDGPLGQPLLATAIVSFECELIASHDHGTHSILVGRVGAMQGKNKKKALLYLDGQYATAAHAVT